MCQHCLILIIRIKKISKFLCWLLDCFSAGLLIHGVGPASGLLVLKMYLLYTTCLLVENVCAVHPEIILLSIQQYLQYLNIGKLLNCLHTLQSEE